MPCLGDETVLAFVQGSLAEDALRAAEAHLSGCPDCCALVADAARLSRPESVDSVDPPPLLAPGTQVSRYVIEEALGAGGAGVVYRALDPELKRGVALKILRTDTQDLRARWLREAQTMARLSHPHVVNVYDLGTHEGHVFIVLELVEGQNLAQWLRAEPRAWRAVLDAFVQAGRGLAAAHAAGLVHRDFKPENVLMGADGRARVADFGLARRLDEKPREAIVGTPGFMAPEQMRGQEADARSDQFSFCVALYGALHGKRPTAGGGAPASEAPAGAVPAGIEEALRRGLNADAAARFASMDDLLSALSAVSPAPASDGVREPAAPPPSFAGAPRRRARRWLPVGAIAAGVLTIAGFGIRRLVSPDGACIVDVALGFNHTCVLRQDRTVWCWGKVGFEGFDVPGPTGDPEPASRVTPLQIRDGERKPLAKIADITAKVTTTCARELQGVLWCWGAGERGKLGNGRAASDRRLAIAERVKAPGDWGLLGAVARVAPGPLHTCVIQDEGGVRCWGDNGRGQIGSGSAGTEPILMPRGVVGAGPAFARVACGQYHTCGARTDGTLWCWGDNGLGQSGQPPTPARHSGRPARVEPPVGEPVSDFVDLDLGVHHTCAATKSGALYCFGGNEFGQLGSGSHEPSNLPVAVRAAPGDAPLGGVVSVRAGYVFTCALRADRTVWCFGANNFGQLGAGSTLEASTRAVPVLVGAGGTPLGDVEKIAVGAYSACALRRDGSLWCWGRNQGAQLGVADRLDRNVAVEARGPCRR